MGIYTNRVFDGANSPYSESTGIILTVFIMYSNVIARQTFLISDFITKVTLHPMRAQSLRFYVFEGQPVLKLAVWVKGLIYNMKVLILNRIKVSSDLNVSRRLIDSKESEKLFLGSHRPDAIWQRDEIFLVLTVR